MATSQRNIVSIYQHCWPSICELRPNDSNIWTQQTAALLSATCSTSLATLLQRVTPCCELKIELVRMPRRNIVAWTWLNEYNIMQHPQMLREIFDQFQLWANNTQYVATGWPNACNMLLPTLSRSVAIVWLGLNAAENFDLVCAACDSFKTCGR